MTKRVTTDDLSAYLDGEFPESEMQRVRTEIASDSEAARLLEELRSVDASVRRAPVEPPAAYFEALPGRIRARLPVAAQRKSWRPPVWSLAAVAALFVAALTPLALREGPAPVAKPVPLPAAKQVGADAPREAPPASAAPAAPAVTAPAREAGSLARSEADARSPRDEQFEKRRDRVQALESKVQARPTPAAELAGRLQTKDESEAETRKLKADVASVEAQQDFAQPPRQAPAQEFGPRVNQQAAPPRGPMKKEAAGAAPQPTAKPAPAGFAEEATVVADKNTAGLRAATAPAAPPPVDSLSRRPASATEARSLREEARRFAEANPGDARADLARVRVIELGIQAWRTEGRIEDRDRARADADAYLAREDARQKDRVRELLRTLTP